MTLVRTRNHFGQAVNAHIRVAAFNVITLDYAANIAATREAARWAHQPELLLEAELGYIGGKAGSALSAHAPSVRTDPTEVRSRGPNKSRCAGSRRWQHARNDLSVCGA
jgi:fructose/tagatose bisphosphate aldolase